MELLQLISGQTPAVALAIVIWYFSNRDILRFLQERREMIEALRLERQEWLTAMRQITTQYEERTQAATETRVANTAELHALKSRMTELILKVEALLMIAKSSRGEGSND